MCHIVKWKGAHKVQTPIRCYKVVIKVYDEINDKYSYHPVFCNSHKMTYELGCTEKTRRPTRAGRFNMTVNEGLHSFKPEVLGWVGTARWVDLRLQDDSTFTFGEWKGVKAEAAVLECVIPAGALYFEGEANCIFGGPDEKGFVSDTITPIKEVPRSAWPAMTFIEYSERNHHPC